MNDMMKVVQALEDSNILLKGVTKTIKNETKEQQGGFLSLRTLGPSLQDGAYVTNLDEYTDVGTHWITLFSNRSENVYFDSFGVEHVPEETKKFAENKDIIANIF